VSAVQVRSWHQLKECLLYIVVDRFGFDGGHCICVINGLYLGHAAQQAWRQAPHCHNHHDDGLAAAAAQQQLLAVLSVTMLEHGHGDPWINTHDRVKDSATALLFCCRSCRHTV
jgi:hypothetical protein